MPITDATLAHVRDLRATVGSEADDATRDITRQWAAGWDTVAPLYTAALADLAAQAVAAGVWLTPWELARHAGLQRAGQQAQVTLTALAGTAVTVTSTAAGNAIGATVEAEPQVMASQLPASERANAAAAFAAATGAGAAAALTATVAASLTFAPTALVSASAYAASRALVRGVPIAGGTPTVLAPQLLTGVEHGFHAGLTSAIGLARTETLDAYRTAARQVHAANTRWVQGWLWLSRLDLRTCPSCWAMHGSAHLLTEPGPNDHRQGRCSRVVKLLPWSRLGISRREQADRFPDAPAEFNALPEAGQLAVMGPARLELLRSGQVDWADLPVRRANPRWRSAYVPRTVADLRSRARATAAA